MLRRVRHGVFADLDMHRCGDLLLGDLPVNGTDNEVTIVSSGDRTVALRQLTSRTITVPHVVSRMWPVATVAE